MAEADHRTSSPSPYIIHEIEFLEAIQEGIDDMAQGHVVDHAKVVADWSRLRSHPQA